MAARTVIDALTQKYAGFSFAGKPRTLWLGSPPTKETDGSLIALPICELYPEGGTNQSTGGHAHLAHTNVRIEVYADSMTTLQNIVLGMLYNGGAIDAGLGFQFALSLPFDSTVTLMACYLRSEPSYELQQDRSTAATRVYKATVELCVETLYTG